MCLPESRWPCRRARVGRHARLGERAGRRGRARPRRRRLRHRARGWQFARRLDRVGAGRTRPSALGPRAGARWWLGAGIAGRAAPPDAVHPQPQALNGAVAADRLPDATSPATPRAAVAGRRTRRADPPAAAAQAVRDSVACPVYFELMDAILRDAPSVTSAPRRSSTRRCRATCAGRSTGMTSPTSSNAFGTPASPQARPLGRSGSARPSTVGVPADQPHAAAPQLGSGGEGYFAYEGWLLGGVRESGKAEQFASARRVPPQATGGLDGVRTPVPSPAAAATSRGLDTRAGFQPRHSHRPRGVRQLGAGDRDRLDARRPRRGLSRVRPALGSDVADHVTRQPRRTWPCTPRTPRRERRCRHRSSTSPCKSAWRDLELADVPRRLRPDHRFALLQRNPIDWEAVTARLDEILGDDPRWSELQTAHGLTAEMFSPRLRPIWATANDTVYAAFAAALAENQCPTLANEGHHAPLRALLAQLPVKAWR